MAKSDSEAGLKLLGYAEKLLYILVGVGLVVMAALVLFQSAKDLINLSSSTSITLQVATVLNDILFAIILLELLSTVVTHLSVGGFQLKPFLIIGIISSVRRVLVLGAQLSTANIAEFMFQRELIELALDGLVALILTVSLVIVSKYRPEID